VSRIRADGVDHDKHTIGLWRQRLSLSRQAVPSLNQRNRVGTDRDGGSSNALPWTAGVRKDRSFNKGSANGSNRPEAVFKMGPMNGRKRRESGRRHYGQDTPRARVPDADVLQAGYWGSHFPRGSSSESFPAASSFRIHGGGEGFRRAAHLEQRVTARADPANRVQFCRRTPRSPGRDGRS
jgi:hypothetical protein